MALLRFFLKHMQQLFDNKTVQLKVCGVTRAADAAMLVEERIHAMGINFWPKSRRYCAPVEAAKWLAEFAGHILRVGVFVNATQQHILGLWQQGLLDAVQLHGDEPLEFALELRRQGLPLIRAVSVHSAASLQQLERWDSTILLDTPAGNAYGGSGKSFDWSLARDFVAGHAGLECMLAGGINPQNARQAAELVRPRVLDVASGGELNYGIKERGLCRAMQQAIDGVSCL